MISQRDAVISKIIESLDHKSNIFFLSADFGAPKLDILRKNYQNNFIHCGISEQAMIDVASGMALEGKFPICYAMAPFISIRALEQIKCGPGLMNLPICILSVGIGIGYADAGPTHYTTEDLACLRSISNISIYTCSDSSIASQVIDNYLNDPHFCYIRLDRDPLNDLNKPSDQSQNKYRIYGIPSLNKFILIAHGKMTHIALEVQEKFPDKFVVVDLIRSKPFPYELIDLIINSQGFITVDEQTNHGSLYSIVCENLQGRSLSIPSDSISLNDNYIFENGGRKYLLEANGISQEFIISCYNKLNK